MPAISSDGDDERDDVGRVLPPRQHDDVVVVASPSVVVRPTSRSSSTSTRSSLPADVSDAPRRATVPPEHHAWVEGGNADVALLEVQDVTVRFGGIIALDGLSFSIDEGQICGLIGPNGAGKTTMFNVVSRIYQPTAGRVVFDGQDLLAVARPRHRQPGIARTFQNLALFPTMTLLENVMVGAHSQGKVGIPPVDQPGRRGDREPPDARRGRRPARPARSRAR